MFRQWKDCLLILCVFVAFLQGTPLFADIIPNGDFTDGLNHWLISETRLNPDKEPPVFVPDVEIVNDTENNNKYAWIKDMPYNSPDLELSTLTSHGFDIGPYTMLRFDFFAEGGGECEEFTATLSNNGGTIFGKEFFKAITGKNENYIDKFDWVQVEPVDPEGWRRVSLPVLSEWGEVTLQFGLTRKNNDIIPDYVFVDNVALVVPEPASMTMGLLGLSVAGWKLRKRKQMG